MESGAFPTSSLVLIAIVTIVPLALMTTTSFLKFSVVFSILSNALGSARVPGGTAVVALSAILSFYVMAPVGQAMLANSTGALSSLDRDNPLGDVPALTEAARQMVEPLKSFLSRNANPRERRLFLDLARRPRFDGLPREAEEHDLFVVLPAFVITELSEAFLIGFLIFIPFLVVDLVLMNVLVALGMTSISPVQVSAPFKLLLFILVDGWYLLSRALVLGYS